MSGHMRLQCYQINKRATGFLQIFFHVYNFKVFLTWFFLDFMLVSWYLKEKQFHNLHFCTKQCFSHFVTTIGLATLQDSKHGVAKNLRAQGGKSNTSKKNRNKAGDEWK